MTKITDERLALDRLLTYGRRESDGTNDGTLFLFEGGRHFFLSDRDAQSLRAQGGVRVKAALSQLSAIEHAIATAQDGLHDSQHLSESYQGWIDAEFSELRRILSSLEASPAPVSEEIEAWRRNSNDTWSAMTAMRNDINEYIPMPSIEGDLLRGPENSVFCAEVAKAVVSYVVETRDLLASAAVFVDEKYEPAIDSEYGLHQRLRAALTEKGGQ